VPLIQRALIAVQNYLADVCDEVLGLAMVSLSPEAAARNILSLQLHKAGERWYLTKLRVAQEHLLAAFIATSPRFRRCQLDPGLSSAELGRAVKKTGAVTLGLSLICLTEFRTYRLRSTNLSKLLSKGVCYG
jgi:hypothetical protein